MTSSRGVDLGYAEKVASWKLSSHLFPSKIGGKPAWLCLNSLPSYDDLKCEVCGESCVFLLQIYSPLNESDESFHRTLFVFVCRNPSCCRSCDNRNLVVFRSDLPKENQFYSPDHPDYDHFDLDKKYPSARDHQDMCNLCGCAGKKLCSKCKKATYCSRSHQVIDWKSGHKATCSQDDSSAADGTFQNSYLFIEYGLDMEEEESDTESNDADDEGDDDDDNDEDEDDAKSLERKMKEYKKVSKLTKKKYSVKELEAHANAKEDKANQKFKKVVENDREQVVRHERGGVPLWITDDHQLKNCDVPKCQYCGSERQFEFQVMPHLVSKLELDSLENGQSVEWGILCIYTCSKNCTGPETSYRKEFIYKQDITREINYKLS